MTAISCYQSDRKKNKAGRRLNLKWVNYGLAFACLALGFMYMLNINDLTVKGFALRELKSRAAELADQRLAAEQQVNALQSYYSLSQRAQGLDMVAVSNIDYLTVSPGALAKK